ncbi:MAG TPA: aspartate kinase [Candidatus Dormibacteraeota bacterium]|jgi:aspartate kinase|nr:aspartate kinase [Candidatus Dormibacteraeota bacterium]
MAIIVQKYGGTSVADIERIRRVAERVGRTRAECDGVVVVVSAMGDTTDELIALAHQLSDDPPLREMDMLLSTGETITAPLLAMALEAAGTTAVSLTGLQAGIRTSGSHRKARIVDIAPTRIAAALEQGRVAVIAGFQGVTEEFDITTLGRGGSDTSAVALAVALRADHCEIYTDVRGVFTADPRLVPTARHIPEISYEEMLEFAAVGAKVMHPRAVEIGEAYDMPIWVRSAFEDSPGTIICRHPTLEDRQKVRGIAHEIDVAKITLLHVPDRPGVAAAIFGPLADHHINVDVILQNVGHDGSTDLSFTLAESDLMQARPLVALIAAGIGANGYEATADIAKVSVVGTGMLNTPGIAATMFKTLAEADINILLISTSEIRITCIIDRGKVRDAVRALHRAYQLDEL